MLNNHLAYLRYVLRHKWFVLAACREVGAPLWRGLVHDASKFLPSEWFAYVDTFYAPDGSSQYKESDAFNVAWNKHQKRNKHHWQYWMLTSDEGNTVSLKMPEMYVREMVADWIGAGLAITGKREAPQWYLKNKEKMRLHAETRQRVESLLGVANELV